MNVKLRVLTAGVLFFTGQAVMAQKKTSDSTKEAKIEEVVVIGGYNKTFTKPKDVTATTTISADKLENRPNTSFLSSLQGEAPGLQVNTTSGSPGSGKIDIIIRGVSSILAQSDPLFVIDGMISNATQYRNLNPSDIETVSVLKDAGATSIYGNRGANGVIVIRTKRGKFGSKLNVTYATTYGISLMPKTRYDMANAKELLQIQKNANNGVGSSMTDAEIAAYNIDTDWRKVFFRTGITQNHDLAMQFGGETVNNYTSLGYLEQTGTVPTTDFKRFTLRNNLTAKSKDEKFNFSFNTALGYSKRNQLDEETNSNISANVVQNPLLAANIGNPTLQNGIYATGMDLYNGIGQNFDGGKNIYVLENILKGTLPNRLTETSILANFNATYKITDDLTFGNRSGIDYKYSDRIFARIPQGYLAIVVAKSSATTAVPNPYGGSESITKNQEFNFNSTTNLNYHKVVGEDHTFDVGAYVDYLKVDYTGTGQTQNGLIPQTYSFGAGTGYAPFSTSQPTFYRPSISASRVKAGTFAYFGTLDYDYKGKYGFSGVVRRDASYRFSDDNKWATFWSVAGRWNIDQESFMEGSSFSMLKLRGSYGTQGNQNVVSAAYGTNPLLVGTNLVRTNNTVSLGYNNLQAGSYLSTLGNPYLTWEEISQLDLGLDFALWNRKIEGTFDYYRKKTTQLYNSLNVSAITGTTAINYNNGSLQNQGVEMSLRYNAIKNKDFNLSVYANGSYNRNKILSLIKSDEAGTTRNVVGGQLAEWYMVPYLGVNQANGNLLFLDAQDNVTENPNIVSDARATGKSYLPKWVGGFGLNAEYKGVFLDAHFSFQQGAWKYDNQYDWIYDASTVNNYNVSNNLLNAWTPTNANTNVPSLSADNVTYVSDSDRYLKDASFLRLKNIVLGYSLPKSVLNNTGLRSVKLFLQAENILTFTKWAGYDPEPTFTYSTSVYPNLRTVSLGANIDF